MRTKNIEGGASHKGSRAPKTTVAKGTKDNSSVASSSSKQRKPGNEYRVLWLVGCSGGCGNNDKCAEWYNVGMHDTVKAKVKKLGQAITCGLSGEMVGHYPHLPFR
ncbi:unnamed protein product [Prunus armeniaca]|uniref:Uncharacterized protein n=1 Tax=Prunus armeniaca TaxID=36596 RepID=A0A6J5UQ66_PRUAR|nr:unnamed protein product [Prunus armeniaca]